MKTKEELNALKEEVETVSKKLHELTDDELDNVTGGFGGICTERGCTSVSENTCYYPTPCSKLCISPRGDCTCSNGVLGVFPKPHF